MPESRDATDFPNGSNHTLKHRTYTKVGYFFLKASLIFDERKQLLTSGREWTQNVYNNIPYDIIPCFVAINGRSLTKNNFDFYCHCKYEGCIIMYQFKSHGIQKETIDFDDLSCGSFNPDIHKDVISRSYSASSEMKLLAMLLSLEPNESEIK